MRAARICAPGDVRMVDVPVPEPGPRQVRVRIEGCGVCGSNLPVWEGKPWFDYPQAPGAPGHEAWGAIDAVGEGVDAVAPGDRVAFLGERGFAELDLCAEDALVPLPAELEGRAFPAEPLGCAMNVFRRSGIEAGHTVAVVGAGFLGALVTRLASAAGARVVALSQRAFSRETALAMGAEVAFDLEDAAVEQARRHIGGEGFDRVVEATGAQEALDVATGLTRVRGRLIIAGFHQDGPRQIDMRVWNWRGLDVINAHEREAAAYREGMRDAIGAVLDGTLDLDALLTHRYALDEMPRALEDLRCRPDGFLKGVVLL